MSSFPVVLNVYDMVRKNHFLLLNRPRQLCLKWMEEEEVVVNYKPALKYLPAIYSLYYLNLSVLDKSLHLSCRSWGFSFGSSCSWERLVEVLQITSNWIGMYVKCDIAHEQLAWYIPAWYIVLCKLL